jgi:hypothetical protein
MEEAILQAPTDSAAAAKASTAFGANWQSRHDELKKTISDMKDATMTVIDTDPQTFDNTKPGGPGPRRAAYGTKSGRTGFGST